MSPAGYSGTPLYKKLGLKEGMRSCFINEPSHYFSLFDEIPEIIECEQHDNDLEFIHIFCTKRAEFIEYLKNIIPKLSQKGMIWISYPKKTSSIPTELERNVVCAPLFEQGLVDTKVCAIDQDWTALKFMIRRENRR